MPRYRLYRIALCLLVAVLIVTSAALQNALRENHQLNRRIRLLTMEQKKLRSMVGKLHSQREGLRYLLNQQKEANERDTEMNDALEIELQELRQELYQLKHPGTSKKEKYRIDLTKGWHLIAVPFSNPNPIFTAQEMSDYRLQIRKQKIIDSQIASAEAYLASYKQH